MNPDVPLWMTRTEVAERLRLPVSTLSNWASKGVGPKYHRFGRHCRYKFGDVVAWEDQQVAS